MLAAYSHPWSIVPVLSLPTNHPPYPESLPPSHLFFPMHACIAVASPFFLHDRTPAPYCLPLARIVSAAPSIVPPAAAPLDTCLRRRRAQLQPAIAAGLCSGFFFHRPPI